MVSRRGASRNAAKIHMNGEARENRPPETDDPRDLTRDAGRARRSSLDFPFFFAYA
jgi:hypothetical protein